MDLGLSSHVNSHVISHLTAGVNSGVKRSPPLIGGLFTLISLPRFLEEQILPPMTEDVR